MLSYLLGGTGLVLVLYWLVSTLSVGSVGFTNVLLAAGIAGIALGILDSRYGALPGVLRVKKVVLPLLAVGIACFAALEAVIIFQANHQDRGRADYVLVLGAGLRGDQPSLTLVKRLDTALETGNGGKYVVSGGQGWNETIPEADAMAEYLEGHGVPSGQIIREDRSTSTMENLRYSRELMEADSGKPVKELRVKIISSDFHLFRAKMLAARAGYGKVMASGAPTPAMVAPSSYIREAFALVKSFFLDR